MEFQTQAFWLKTVTLKADISDDKYFTLFPIKEEVDKILAKALELNMEKDVIEEWRQLAVLVNNLIEGLKNKSHTEAIKSLKISLGGARGLNEENSRLARRILRDSHRAQPVEQQWGQPQWGQQNMSLPFMAPPNFAAHGFPQPAPTAAPYAGSCFNCNQYGHMARDCPLPYRNYGPQGRGRRSGGRQMSLLPPRGGRSGRRGRN